MEESERARVEAVYQLLVVGVAWAALSLASSLLSKQWRGARRGNSRAIIFVFSLEGWAVDQGGIRCAENPIVRCRSNLEVVHNA